MFVCLFICFFQLECCGSKNYTDWFYNEWTTDGLGSDSVPQSCCIKNEANCNINVTEHPDTIFPKVLLRWPMGVTAQPKTLTAQPNISQQNQTAHSTTKNCHGTTKYLAAQPNSSRHNQKLSQQNRKMHPKANNSLLNQILNSWQNRITSRQK